MYQVTLNEEEMLLVLKALEDEQRRAHSVERKAQWRAAWNKFTDIYESRDADEPAYLAGQRGQGNC